MNNQDEASDVPGAAQTELLQATWAHDQVIELFSDLTNGAEVEHVQVRTTSDAGNQDLTATLPQALEWFTRGEAKAIQIRYTFDGTRWCDTLMVEPTTVRVIRSPIS